MTDKIRKTPARIISDAEAQTLIQKSGLRLEASNATQQDVYAQTHAAWRAALENDTSRKPGVWLPAIAAALLVAVLVTLLVPRMDQNTAMDSGFTVARVSGAVPLAVSDILQPGTSLQTGAGQLIAIDIKPAGSLRVNESSQLEILRSGQVKLLKGAVYVDTANGVADISIVTSAGLVQHLGTQFMVHEDTGGTTVLVREGTVTVETDFGPQHLGEGVGITIKPGGETLRRSVSAYADEWQWTQNITPEFEIEGRSALEYLQWVSRESGYTLEFASPASRQHAGSIRLSGTVASFTPLESLDVVLASTRLQFHLDAGNILVK